MTYVVRNTKIIRQAVAVIGLWLTLGIVGCSNDENVMATSGQPATIRGRVEGNEQSSGFAKTTGSVEGAIVTVVQLHQNGSASVVSVNPVETDASGEFIVQTSLEGASNLEVVAEKNGVQWKAIVTASVSSGTVVTSKPLNIESTVEAEVYEEIVSNGDTDEVTPADISLSVSAELAANLYGDNNAIVDFASALTFSAESQEYSLTTQGINASEAELELMQQNELRAEDELSTNLYFAGSNQSASDAATNRFVKAMVTANSHTSVSNAEYARSIEISGQALINASSELDEDARTELEMQTALVRSVTLSAAIESEFSMLTSSQAVNNSVVQAGATLHATISSANDTTAVQAAFEVYHDAIINLLGQAMTSFSATVNNLDATINADGGAKASLSASVASAANAEALASTYFNFYSSVRTSVSSALGSASSVQISSTSEILTMTNMIV